VILLSNEKIAIAVSAGIAAFALLGIFVSSQDGSGNICDQGCSLDSGCSGSAPYLCKKSWWPDSCVAKGYDGGACGGKAGAGGYCYECSGGCVLQSELGGKCGLLTTCNSDEYCCKRAEWYASNVCKPKYADMGCCGGPPAEGDRITFLKATITNNRGSPCTGKIIWEARAKGAADYADYTADCVEGNPEIKLNSGSSITATCTSQKLPPAASGPNDARISWCGESGMISYERIVPLADTSIILKYPDAYGQPSSKTLKLTCKTEKTPGSVLVTEVRASYDSISIFGGLQLVKFRFSKDNLAKIAGAGCTW
jgi:hypothetical protein